MGANTGTATAYRRASAMRLGSCASMRARACRSRPRMLDEYLVPALAVVAVIASSQPSVQIAEPTQAPALPKPPPPPAIHREADVTQLTRRESATTFFRLCLGAACFAAGNA